MATIAKPPVLVVLQLGGGNDTVNTVVPYSNPLYYDNRTNVRVNEADVLKIDDNFGFHPSMAAMKPFWDNGKMAVINGIGYPDPNYSHFRSMDIWYTAEPEKMETDGWLGKAVRELDPKADNVLTAVNFGRGLPRALSLAGVPGGTVPAVSPETTGRRQSMTTIVCSFESTYQPRPRRLVSTEQLVQFEVDRLGVAVLRVLDQEGHQEGDDRRAGVDHQLPDIGEVE